jgi:hypothetical protein
VAHVGDVDVVGYSGKDFNAIAVLEAYRALEHEQFVPCDVVTPVAIVVDRAADRTDPDETLVVNYLVGEPVPEGKHGLAHALG